MAVQCGRRIKPWHVKNFLRQEQIDEEQELRSRLGTVLEERANIVHFDADEIVDGEEMDPGRKGLQKVTISLCGKEKYISIFDYDEVGMRFYLEGDEVERLLKDKFLHLTFRVPIPKE